MPLRRSPRRDNYVFRMSADMRRLHCWLSLPFLPTAMEAIVGYARLGLLPRTARQGPRQGVKSAVRQTCVGLGYFGPVTWATATPQTDRARADIAAHHPKAIGHSGMIQTLSVMMTRVTRRNASNDRRGAWLQMKNDNHPRDPDTRTRGDNTTNKDRSGPLPPTVSEVVIF